MLRLQFKQLVEMIGTFAKEISNCFWKDFVSFDNRVALTLYYLKEMASMKMTANLGVAWCTEGVIIYAVTEQFDNCGFPQEIGCIDGTYVPVKHPCENEKYCFFHKMFYSITCQARCSTFGYFTNVEVGLPGIVHDTHVFTRFPKQNICYVLQRATTRFHICATVKY